MSRAVVDLPVLGDQLIVSRGTIKFMNMEVRFVSEGDAQRSKEALAHEIECTLRAEHVRASTVVGGRELLPGLPDDGEPESLRLVRVAFALTRRWARDRGVRPADAEVMLRAGTLRFLPGDRDEARVELQAGLSVAEALASAQAILRIGGVLGD